jgi:hypothetical protein
MSAWTRLWPTSLRVAGRMPDCRHLIEQAWCGECNPARGPESSLETWISQAFMAIPTDGQDPKPVDEAAFDAGLIRYEFNQATAAIRERYPDLPLVSDRNGIRFTLDPDAVDRYRRARLSQAETLIRRTVRGVIEPFKRAVGASDAEVRVVERSVQRLMEDIRELIERP